MEFLFHAAYLCFVSSVFRHGTLSSTLVFFSFFFRMLCVLPCQLDWHGEAMAGG